MSFLNNVSSQYADTRPFAVRSFSAENEAEITKEIQVPELANNSPIQPSMESSMNYFESPMIEQKEKQYMTRFASPPAAYRSENATIPAQPYYQSPLSEKTPEQSYYNSPSVYEAQKEEEGGLTMLSEQISKSHRLETENFDMKMRIDYLEKRLSKLGDHEYRYAMTPGKDLAYIEEQHENQIGHSELESIKLDHQLELEHKQEAIQELKNLLGTAREAIETIRHENIQLKSKLESYTAQNEKLQRESEIKDKSIADMDLRWKNMVEEYRKQMIVDNENKARIRLEYEQLETEKEKLRVAYEKEKQKVDTEKTVLEQQMITLKAQLTQYENWYTAKQGELDISRALEDEKRILQNEKQKIEEQSRLLHKLEEKIEKEQQNIDKEKLEIEEEKKRIWKELDDIDEEKEILRKRILQMEEGEKQLVEEKVKLQTDTTRFLEEKRSWETEKQHQSTQDFRELFNRNEELKTENLRLKQKNQTMKLKWQEDQTLVKRQEESFQREINNLKLSHEAEVAKLRETSSTTDEVRELRRQNEALQNQKNEILIHANEKLEADEKRQAQLLEERNQSIEEKEKLVKTTQQLEETIRILNQRFTDCNEQLKVYQVERTRIVTESNRANEEKLKLGKEKQLLETSITNLKMDLKEREDMISRLKKYAAELAKKNSTYISPESLLFEQIKKSQELLEKLSQKTESTVPSLRKQLLADSKDLYTTLTMLTDNLSVDKSLSELGYRAVILCRQVIKVAQEMNQDNTTSSTFPTDKVDQFTSLQTELDQISERIRQQALN